MSTCACLVNKGWVWWLVVGGVSKSRALAGDNRNNMLAILYQDESVVAVHKPPGLLVHKTGLDAHEQRFALQMLRDQLGQKVWPVHRLDKGTSGVLLFALNSETASKKPTTPWCAAGHPKWV
jgi:23S rRNA-/tRNA-specific pseudouridylate synthase